MKKLFSVFLIVSLIILISACASTPPTPVNKTVNFYYCTEAVVYDSPDGVIAPEKREYDLNTNTLEALLNLYLRGPVHKSFVSPFPDGVYAESITMSNNRIHITLSSVFSDLKGLDLTLACICISKTAQELANVDYVYINYEDSLTGKQNSVTIGPDSYLLYEDGEHVVTSEE